MFLIRKGFFYVLDKFLFYDDDFFCFRVGGRIDGVSI